MKSKLGRLFAAIVSITAGATSAMGNIVVHISPTNADDYLTDGQIISGTVTLTCSSNYTGSTTVVYTITGGTGDNLGDVMIDATCPNAGVQVAINGGGTTGQIGSVGNVSSVGSSSSVWLDDVRVLGAFGTSGHTTSVTHIGGMQAYSYPGNIEVVPASDGRFQPDIGTIVAGLGGVRGNILAESGTIDKIYCSATSIGATIGTSGSPVSIRAGVNIGRVTADEIYANISGPSGDEYAPTFSLLQARHGPFEGSLKMAHFAGNVESLSPGIFVFGGDLTASVAIAGDMELTTSPAFLPKFQLAGDGGSLSAGVVPSGTTIVIGDRLKGVTGGSVDSNYAFDLPYHGLQGQIIVNASNSYSSNAWTSPVHFAASGANPAITLDDAASSPDTAPHYTRSAASLGGGAVGVVPFAINPTDCHPTPYGYECTVGTKTWPGSSVRETLVIAYYGPVLDASSGGYLPVIVERTDLACPVNHPCPDPVDISADCDVMVGMGDGGREIWVSLTPDEYGPIAFATGYRYTVTPRPDDDTTMVRSDGTLQTEAPPVDSTSYWVDLLCD